MKVRLHKPRELAIRLLAIARLRPRDVETYLDTHSVEWEALAGAAPYDVADILEELGEEAATDLIADLTAGDAAEVLEEMRPELAADILEELPAPDAAVVLEEMDPDDAADVIAELEPDTRALVLEHLEDETAAEVLELLAYPPDSAGGLMTTEVASLPVGMTAGEAIEAIRRLHEELEDLSYVYITDDLGRLVGVLSFRDLVFNRPGAGLDEVMVPNPVAVAPDTDREEVAEVIQRYHLFGLPVVDQAGLLLGMVNTDAVLEAVQQEASEDFAQAVGAGAEDTVFTPVRRSVRTRLPWIAVDVGLSFLVAFVIGRFEDVIQTTTVLASLMPLVARVGGDSGAQSLAVVIRSIATGDVPASRARQVVGREIRIGLINGLVIALLSGLLGALFQSAQTPPGLEGAVAPARIGTILFLATWANLVLAGLSGSGIPLLLRRLGLDPALASNLLLTTVTDLIGFGGFLAVATILL